MSTTSSEPVGKLPADATLQEQARRHLWMHFTRMGGYSDLNEIPIIVRGEGCYVYDEHGKRYLDGLASLFCTNIGHGRADVAQAGADQAKELGFFTNWSYAHPPRDRARGQDRLARARRPEPRVLHQRRRRGRRVGAEARPPVPQAHRQPQQAQGDRARDRLPRHHHGRAAGDRHHGIRARAVRAADARRLPRPQHQHLPAARTDACRSSPRPSPTGSSSRALTRSRP